MAMLAEPRRKQKVINLRAGNKAWSEDSNKFGQKMLERMGWKSGKGLGAREDGIVSHVVARYKNDEKGLGYEDRADQWTQHEDSFERLLASLASDESQTTAETSGKSLEQKSKQSRARVHYHKFTRGKDLSRYSKKDLANIFGKKSLDPAESENQTDTPEPISEEKSDDTSDKQVFTTGGSMLDYFSSKLKALGRQCPVQNIRENSPEQDFSFRGFNTSPIDESEQNSQSAEPFPQPEATKFRKKKKKNKETDTVAEEAFITDSNALAQESSTEQGLQNEYQPEDCKVKKKKKNKKQKEMACNPDNILVDTNCDETSVEQEKEINENIKKKKKKKRGLYELDAQTNTEEHIEFSSEPVKKKKKKSRLS